MDILKEIVWYMLREWLQQLVQFIDFPILIKNLRYLPYAKSGSLDSSYLYVVQQPVGLNIV